MAPLPRHAAEERAEREPRGGLRDGERGHGVAVLAAVVVALVHLADAPVVYHQRLREP
jgi:hypothetical protein